MLLAESFDTSTPHGKFALTMFAAIAESGLADHGTGHKRQAPLGYEYANEAWMLSEQADTVRRIFELFVIDGYSLSVIAQILNEEGVETQRGGSGILPRCAIS